MTPRTQCMALIVVLYAVLATSVDLIVSAVVARLSFPPGSTGLLVVFLGVFAAGVAGTCWGGSRVLAEVERCWDALEEIRDLEQLLSLDSAESGTLA